MALQKTRKKKIEELIKWYQKQVDDIFTYASQPLPIFAEVKDKDDLVIMTAEQQVYEFIDVRKKALGNANYMLNIINELENELLDPNYKKGGEEEEKNKEEPKKINRAKKLAQQQNT